MLYPADPQPYGSGFRLNVNWYSREPPTPAQPAEAADREISMEVADLIGGGGWTRTNDLRIMSTQPGSELFGEFSTLLPFSTAYKSAGLIPFASI